MRTRASAERPTPAPPVDAEAAAAEAALEEKRQRKREASRRQREKHQALKQTVEFKLSKRPNGNGVDKAPEMLKARAKVWTEVEKAHEKGLPPPEHAILSELQLPWTPLKVPQSGTLPFTESFQKAPLLGADTQANLIVRSPTGNTILQRLNPTCFQKAIRVGTEAKAGKLKATALFDALKPDDRHGGEVAHLGHWYCYETNYGWTKQHRQKPVEGDAMLRWVWLFFHEHIYTLRRLIAADFLHKLEGRKESWEWFSKDKMGEEQCSLTHHWWLMAAIAASAGDRPSQVPLNLL